jgi:hypothetical protein
MSIVSERIRGSQESLQVHACGTYHAFDLGIRGDAQFLASLQVKSSLIEILGEIRKK